MNDLVTSNNGLAFKSSETRYINGLRIFTSWRRLKTNPEVYCDLMTFSLLLYKDEGTLTDRYRLAKNRIKK